MDIGHIRYPLPVQIVSVESAVEQILAFAQLPAHLRPLFVAANFREKFIFPSVEINDLVFYAWPHFISINCRKSRSNLICVYFLRHIAIPPDVFLFSYIRGYFVYCLFLVDRCKELLIYMKAPYLQITYAAICK